MPFRSRPFQYQRNSGSPGPHRRSRSWAPPTTPPWAVFLSHAAWGVNMFPKNSVVWRKRLEPGWSQKSEEFSWGSCWQLFKKSSSRPNIFSFIRWSCLFQKDQAKKRMVFWQSKTFRKKKTQCFQQKYTKHLFFQKNKTRVFWPKKEKKHIIF